jgi:hypothetical protein
MDQDLGHVNTACGSICEIKSNDYANQTFSQVERLFVRAKVFVSKDTIPITEMFFLLIEIHLDLGENDTDIC